MRCLYAGDYGPAVPGFNALADHGRLIQGYEDHAAALAQAHNLSELEAMERQLARGAEILWCEPGYGWVHDSRLDLLMTALTIAVLVPYALWKLRLWKPGLWELTLARLGPWRRSRPILPAGDRR